MSPSPEFTFVMLKHSCRLYGDTNFYAMQTMIDSNIHFFILVSLLVGLISTRTFATTDHASAFVVDRVKFSLTSMQNLVLVSHTVHAHVGPKNLGGRCSLGKRKWLTPPRIRNMILPTCVTTPNLVMLVMTNEHIYRDPPQSSDPSCQFFKVTQGPWNRHGSIGYLWLPISDPQ